MRAIDGDPLVHVLCFFVIGRNRVVSVRHQTSDAVREVDLRNGHLRGRVVTFELALSTDVTKDKVRPFAAVESQHQVQNVRALPRQIQTRAGVDELNITDLAITDIVEKLEQLRVIPELVIHTYLCRSDLAEGGDGTEVFIVQSKRLLDNDTRHFVLVRNREQRHAQIRLRNDVKQVWLLSVEHFVRVGVLLRKLVVGSKWIEQAFVHIASGGQSSLLHGPVSIRVASTTASAAENGAFVHQSEFLLKVSESRLSEAT